MLRRLLLCSVPMLLVASAFAEPIRYTTDPNIGAGSYTGSPWVRFEGTSGVFEPGSTISLGRFLFQKPASDTTDQFSGRSFVIGLMAPDFYRPYANTPDGPIGPDYSSLMIRGHFAGGAQPNTPALDHAIFDSVEIGYAGPIPAIDHLPQTFPIPLADVKLPRSQLLFIPSDAWVDGKAYHSVKILAQITPEPATWAAWGVVGLGWLAARRRARGKVA